MRCSAAVMNISATTKRLPSRTPADNPEAVFSKKQRGALLQECLTKLPAAQREVIDLVYYHHKSVEEVAQIVGVQASTVKTRMFYARSRLAQMLSEAGVEHAWAA